MVESQAFCCGVRITGALKALASWRSADQRKQYSPWLSSSRQAVMGKEQVRRIVGLVPSWARVEKVLWSSETVGFFVCTCMCEHTCRHTHVLRVIKTETSVIFNRCWVLGYLWTSKSKNSVTPVSEENVIIPQCIVNLSSGLWTDWVLGFVYFFFFELRP